MNDAAVGGCGGGGGAAVAAAVAEMFGEDEQVGKEERCAEHDGHVAGEEDQEHGEDEEAEQIVQFALHA